MKANAIERRLHKIYKDLDNEPTPSEVRKMVIECAKLRDAAEDEAYYGECDKARVLASVAYQLLSRAQAEEQLALDRMHAMPRITGTIDTHDAMTKAYHAYIARLYPIK